MKLPTRSCPPAAPVLEHNDIDLPWISGAKPSRLPWLPSTGAKNLRSGKIREPLCVYLISIVAGFAIPTAPSG